MAAADKHTVAAGFESKEALQRILKAAKSPAAGLTAMPDVAKTAALPAGARGRLRQPRGDDRPGESAGSKFLPPTIPWTDLPAFPATPPVGLAVKVVGHQVQATLVVPPGDPHRDRQVSDRHPPVRRRQGVRGQRPRIAAVQGRLPSPGERADFLRHRTACPLRKGSK